MKFIRRRLPATYLIKFITLTLAILVTFGILSSILIPFYSHAEVTKSTFKATADTYLRRSNASEPFGQLSHIDIVNNDEIISVLRFKVSGTAGKTVSAATMRLSVANGANAANIKVFSVGSSWSESSLAWKKRPALTTQVGELPTIKMKKGDWVEISLGQAVTGDGNYSFALTTDSRDRLAFRSRSTSSAPELVLQLQSGTPDTVPTAQPSPIPQPSPVGQPSPTPVPQDGTSPLTFVPDQIGMDAPEIVNPMRGLYRWMDQEYAVQPIPARDAYDRFTWRELEPTKGDYSFTVLENAIAQAAREGRKYAFRVRTVVSTKGASIPDYAMGGTGWWEDYDNDGTKDTYVPDWNDSGFQGQMETFMRALGKRYDGDPRISFIDIGLYGNWGEWHMASFSYPSSSGAQRATAASKYRIIDMHIAAFPTTQLVMPTDDTDGLVYAMSRSPRIGWRRDSLGWNTGHFEKIESDSARWNAVKDRWQTAPVVTEFVNPRYQDEPAFYQRALDQVKRYHISLVSNGNTQKWSSISSTGKEAFLQLGKTAGYRLALSQLSLPAYVARGNSINITSRWSNVGVAPLYEPWQISIQLRKAGSSQVAWETVSGADVTKLLPNAPFEQTDSVTLPQNLAQGQYDVVVLVQDPRHTRAPLALAIKGQQNDGSYRLGTVTIR